MVEVREHTRNVNGKQILVQRHSRKDSEGITATQFLNQKKMSPEEYWQSKEFGMKVIGKGKFTEFIQKGNRYFLVTSDPLKEIYMNSDESGQYKHFQNLKYVNVDEDRQINKDWVNVYETRKYEEIKANEHPKAWKQMKEIKKIIFDSTAVRGMNYDAPTTLNNFVENIENSKLPTEMKEEIVEVTSDAMNYGEVGLEISPRNVRVDKNGNLILLDIFFDRKKV